MTGLKTLGVMAWFGGWFFGVGPWLVLRATGSSFSAGWEQSPLAGKLALGIALGCLTLQVAAFVRRGRGTPAPFDPPRSIVAEGPYRWSRNPMYLLYVTVMLAQAWAFASPALLVYAAAFFGLAHFYVVRVEEPGLHRRFGGAYEDYTLRVPRWLGAPPR